MGLAMVEEVQLRQAPDERVGVLAAAEDARVFQRESSQYNVDPDLSRGELQCRPRFIEGRAKRRHFVTAM